MHPINADEAGVVSDSEDDASTGTTDDFEKDAKQANPAFYRHPRKIRICKLALGYYLDFWKTGWDTMVTSVENNTRVTHGNKGGMSNRRAHFHQC